MGRATGDDLAAAFERAARQRGPADRAPDDPAARRARAILDARREVRDGEACPAAVLRRVAGWLDARPRGVRARLLRLVHDSRALQPAAVRGAGRRPRLLRWACGGTTVDLEVRTGAEALVVRVAVSPAVPGLVMAARTTPRGRPRLVRLDETGCGELRVRAGARRLDAVFRLRGVPAFRVPSMPLA